MRTGIFFCIAFLLCVAIPSAKARQFEADHSSPSERIENSDHAQNQDSKEKQDDKKPAPQENDISKTYAFDGTYQLEIINTRYMPVLPGNLMNIIRDNRHETNTVYVQINNMLRVKILPKSEINSPGFQPLKEKYIHVKE